MKKRPIILIFITLFIALLIIVGFFLFQKNFLGWRANLTLEKTSTKDYRNYAPNFFFEYPDIFDIDNDAATYGKNYIAGIKLKTDSRTGCDIRNGGPEVNFAASVEDITNSIVTPIKGNSKDFKLIESEKTKISGYNAFKIAFSFMDPIGARIRLDQVLVATPQNRYTIICGTGEYQYSFFSRDFNVFYDSIKFEN